MTQNAHRPKDAILDNLLMLSAVSFRNTLAERLSSASDRPLLHIALFPDFDHPVPLSGNDILGRGRALAAKYHVTGEDEVVLLLLPHSVELFLLHLGLILEGAYPAILPWPTSRVDRRKYQTNLVHQLNHLAAGRLVTVPSLARNLSGTVAFPVAGCELESIDEIQQLFPQDVQFGMAGDIGSVSLPSGLDPDCLFFQFSGGTTGSQKSVAITSAMLLNQLQTLASVLQFGPGDGVASWLPLYHDMGLIACLWLPLWSGAPAVHMGAADWLLSPDLLFRYLDRYKGTFCWLPNFAFSYLAQHRPDMRQPCSLENVRGFINCSEPIRYSSMQAFARAFSGWGVRPEALQGSYAMAENVFAATQTPLDSVPSRSPRKPLSKSIAAQSLSVVDDAFISSGKPLPGVELRIRDANGQLASDGDPGEIEISTPSMFHGYFTKEGCSRASFSSDEWYRTGDYGFLCCGELYVIGRLKDMIIVGGQNIFPEDIEHVVNQIPSVYPGRVVAFGIPDEQLGTEALAVVAEIRGQFSETAACDLETKIRQSVLAAAGIAPRYVTVVPERWILKSTAGKISRRETKERYLAEVLSAAGEVGVF